MNELLDVADRSIFPLVYEIADQIFPEFQFTQKGNHWVSTNKTKIDGSEGNKKGAVYYYQNKPYRFEDVTRPCPGSITTYLIERGACSDWLDAIKYLALKVGVQLREHNLSAEDIERMHKKEQQQTLLETMNDFFIASLIEEKGSDANAIREYLDERGYSDYFPKSKDELHLGNKMELGFIPSQGKLMEYLKSKGFDPQEVNNLFIPGIGTTHKLAIPLYVLGRIVSFAFRTHIKGKKPKYLYPSKLHRSSVLFGFKPPKNNNKDLILVEGLLDALHSKVCGMNNIAALGGTSFNAKQAELISKYGYEKVILCLDNNNAGREGTQSAIDVLLEAAPKIKIYIASLPEDFEDPDELIRSQGIESFHTTVKATTAWYSYLLNQSFDRYTELGEIPDKERDEFFTAAKQISTKIESAVDLEYFITELDILCKPFGLSKETIDNEIRVKREKEKRSEEFKNNLGKAQTLLNSGKEKEARELISNIGKQCNTGLPGISYEELFKPIAREDIIATLEKDAGALNTGLLLNSKPLLLPSGALTFIAGRTGRGKTATLINIAINWAKIPDGGPVVFFTYEENSRRILMKMLNTYIGKAFSENNRACIYDYYRQRDARFNSAELRDEFIRLEKNFFDYLINPGRLIIVDSKDFSDELINKIYYLHKHKQIKAVCIDYAQRINLRNSNRHSRQEELKQICNDLTDCAINTGLPIIPGSQFNRQATDDRNTLTLSNLSEAGDIERVANMVIAVDIKHNQGKTSEFWIKILKNRDGIAEICDTLDYEGNTGKISNQRTQQNPFSATTNKVSPLKKDYEQSYEEAKDGPF